MRTVAIGLVMALAPTGCVRVQSSHGVHEAILESARQQRLDRARQRAEAPWDEALEHFGPPSRMEHHGQVMVAQWDPGNPASVVFREGRPIVLPESEWKVTVFTIEDGIVTGCRFKD